MAYLPMATAATYGDYGVAMHLFSAYGAADFQSASQYSSLSKKALNAQIRATKRQLSMAKNNRTAPNYQSEVARLTNVLNALLAERKRRKEQAKVSGRFQQQRRGTAIATQQSIEKWKTLQAQGFKPRGTIFKFKGKDLPANVVVRPAGARRVAPRALPANLVDLLTQALSSQQQTVAQEAPQEAFVEATAVDLEPSWKDYVTPVNVLAAGSAVAIGVYLYKTRKGKKRR